MNESVTLRASWLIKAPITEVFDVMTDFERWSTYFPKVAEAIEVTSRNGDRLELHATVKSFGRRFR